MFIFLFFYHVSVLYLDLNISMATEDTQMVFEKAKKWRFSLI